MLIGGFYYKQPYRPDKPYRIFNTWLGDPSKLLLLGEVVKIIKQDNLVAKIDDTGKHMLAGLEKLQKHHSGVVINARGRGTFCAIDFRTPELRDKAIKVKYLICLFQKSKNQTFYLSSYTRTVFTVVEVVRQHFACAQH